MKTGIAAVACTVAALAFAGAVSAGDSHDLAAGGGSATVTDPVSGQTEHDQFSVGAVSDPDGTNPRGEVTLSTDAILEGTTLQHFHGDVKDGCLIVTGNRATAVGELPASEQFVASNGQRVRFLAVSVEDNGNGNAVDQASAILLFERSGQRVCAGVVTLPVFPLDHGNFVVQDALP
jgi:hypothetical protein